MKSEIVSISFQFSAVFFFRATFVYFSTHMYIQFCFVFFSSASKSMKVDANCSRGKHAACGLPGRQLISTARITKPKMAAKPIEKITKVSCKSGRRKATATPEKRSATQQVSQTDRQVGQLKWWQVKQPNT